jgi:Gas vesicle synthesis protein GvpL/GvpF
VIELYAITDAAAPPLPRVASLRAVPAGGLAAVCAQARDEDVTAEALWRHEEIVETLMRDRDLLPVRYGTRFGGDDAVARAIGERRGELSAALEQVRGAVELALRVHVTGSVPEPPSDETSGTEYLRAKARAAALEKRVAGVVDEALRPLARESVRRPARAPSEALRAAYLVDRGAVERFRGRVAELADANPALRLLCTGPWPPYSFAER